MNCARFPEVLDNAQIHRCRCGVLCALGSSCPMYGSAAVATVSRRLCKRAHSVKQRAHGQHSAIHSDLHLLCLALCALCSNQRGTGCAMAVCSGRGNGVGCNHPELEQRMAALVLAVVADCLAN